MKSLVIGQSGVRQAKVGPGCPLFLVAGPCVIESRELCLEIAEAGLALAEKLEIGFVFKASFDKANRTSGSSFRGPGLEKGLRILDEIKGALSVPVCSDIHLPSQARPAVEVLDIVQIPAFLSRQTDLVQAAGRAVTEATAAGASQGTGTVIQVKKAQFMAPWDMAPVIGKLAEVGCEDVILVDRGVSFGYNRLVCDMMAVPEMRKLGCPVLVDATHATQQPGGLGTASGGSAELAEVLARSAVAAGADGLFLETHPDPSKALSDAASMLPLERLAPLVTLCRDMHRLVQNA